MELGPGEIVLILVAVAVLFGAKRLPELARSLGRARTEFRKGLQEEQETISPKPDEGHGVQGTGARGTDVRGTSVGEGGLEGGGADGKELPGPGA
jgi:sec-independent protein translocase protein TatA